MNFIDRQVFERVLQMGGGYILDFSDRTFREFVLDSIGIDPSDERYGPSGTSKAKRLRALWELEPEDKVAKLLTDLIRYGVSLKRITTEDAELARNAIPRRTVDNPKQASLEYPSDWRFVDGQVPAMPSAMTNDLYQLIMKMTAGTKDKKGVLETFKSELASASGATSNLSSDFSWAQTDLNRIMGEAGANAATFLDGFWSAVEALRQDGLSCPSAHLINSIAIKHGVGLRIEPPRLVLHHVDIIGDNHGGTSGADAGMFRYTVHEEIGRGGFGTVHRATRDTVVGTFDCAVKFLDPSPFVDDTEKALKRFRREIQALNSIQHRAIVHYIDAGIDTRGRPYVVMQRIQGSNLRDACERLEPPRMCDLLAEVLHGIGHAHEHDLLHRDLKPSNILVRAADQQVIIVDFGNAYIFEEAKEDTLTTQALGTIGYVPSEVLANPKKRTPLHDIYSCGIIAYEVFARRRPDPNAYDSLSHVRPDLAVLDDPIRKAIAGERERFTSAREFREALLGAANKLR